MGNSATGNAKAPIYIYVCLSLNVVVSGMQYNGVYLTEEKKQLFNCRLSRETSAPVRSNLASHHIYLNKRSDRRNGLLNHFENTYVHCDSMLFSIDCAHSISTSMR